MQWVRRFTIPSPAGDEVHVSPVETVTNNRMC